MPQNPFGLHTVTPYLIIENVRDVIAFLEKTLGATLRGEIRMRDDGSVQHTEVTIGDSVVMMGEPMDDFKAMPSTLYVYVDDSDAAYARALENGATSVMEPQLMPHGDRYGGVKDTSGNIWWLVTHVGKPE